MAHGCHFELGVGHGCDSRKSIEALDKANGSAKRHRTHVRQGHESRIIMVPTNRRVYKLKEILKNDGDLLFCLIFLAYLDIGGEHFPLLFLFLASFLYLLYFSFLLAMCILSLLSCFGSTVLRNNIATSSVVSLYYKLCSHITVCHA